MFHINPLLLERYSTIIYILLLMVKVYREVRKTKRTQQLSHNKKAHIHTKIFYNTSNQQ